MAKKGTEIMKWDEELAKQAEAYAEQEANTGGGSFFSTKGGALKFNDNRLPNDEVACVILDSVITNSYYEGEYDPDDPQSPSCYAFGRDEDEMTPHDESSEKQAESCADCEYNKWGSGKGRAKRCKNGRRLALLPAGTFDDRDRFKPYTEEEAFSKGTIGFLNVPPTSINAFGTFVKQIAGTLKRPPHGIFTRVKLVPDGSYFNISFEPLNPIPNALMGAVMKRHAEARDQNETITFPKPEEREKKKPAKKKKGKKKF